MKKLISLMLVLVSLFVFTSGALAAGKATVTQENFFVYSGYSNYAYAFARVENTGDKVVEVRDGILEVYDAEGNVLATAEYPTVGAKYIQPGEYTYLQMLKGVDVDDPAKIQDHAMTITGKSNNEESTLRLETAVEYVPNVKVWSWSDTTRDFVYATVTNNTENPVKNVAMVYAILDAEGNVLYVNNETTYDISLMPGSSIRFEKEVDDSWKEIWEKAGYTPATVEAIGYIYVEN